MNHEDIERLWFQAMRESIEAGEPYIRHRFAALVAAAETQTIERLKHSMREAMYLLDQPEPRPHAAFSELLLALNRDLPSAIRARGKA